MIAYVVPEPLGTMLAANAQATGTSLDEWIEWACWVKYESRAVGEDSTPKVAQ